MGIAKDFNKVVHGQLDVHAAWLPVTNVFQVGDFGVISDGVFVRQGNIKNDFEIEFETVPGPKAKLVFTSEHVRVFRFTAGAEIDVFPEESLEAKLKIEFGREKSFYLKAPLTVEEMQSVFDAARKIAVHPDWDEGKFKVVSATYFGEGCVVLSSRKKNATIEISGKADALKKLELGNAEAGLSITSKSNLGLEIIGEPGIVCLRLFKVKKKGEAEFLAAGDVRPEDLEITESKDLGADLEDTI